MHFTREAQRLMQKSPLMQFLRGETPESLGEQPAASPPLPQKRRRPDPRPLWDLYDANPKLTAKQLHHAYETKTQVKVSQSWIEKNKRRPR
jgi:hypothetical protein